MKKFFALVLCAALAITAFSACANGNDNGTSSVDSSKEESVESTASSEESASSEDTASSEDSSEDTVSSEDSADVSAESGDVSDVAEFNNGYISFNYPADCEKSESDGSVILVSQNGYNINVTTEAASDFYKTLTVEGYKTQIQPSLEAMGFTVSDVVVEQTTNKGGVDATVIGYGCVYNGVMMYQIQMIVTAGDTCQVVTFTETVDCGDLSLEIFDSIKVLK